VAEAHEQKADGAVGAKDFRSRFLGLAIEAYRRRKISHGKLSELAALVEFAPAVLDRILRAVGLADEEGGGEALLPEGLE
jgi:predicted HTH domain antitoxin